MTETKIFAIRTSANREDQVIDFFISKLQRDPSQEVFALIRPHGMRGYVFAETSSKEALDIALQGVPYARGTLPHEIPYPEIEHMLEQVKVEMNVKDKVDKYIDELNAREERINQDRS